MAKNQSMARGGVCPRRALAAGCLVALVALGTGCQGDKSPATPSATVTTAASAAPSSVPTSPSATPSASTTPSSSAPTAVPALSGTQKDVWDKLLQYNDVTNAIMQNPNGDGSKLYTVARDPQATSDMKAALQARNNKMHQVGSWVFLDPQFDRASADIQDKAVVNVCVDARDTKFVDANGKDVQKRHLFRQAYTLTLDSKTMQWFVIDSELKAETC